jgi:hypothetical protein
MNGPTPGTSSNQFFPAMPSLPTQFNPGSMPSPFGSSGSSMSNPWNFDWSGTTKTNSNIGARDLGSGIYSEPSMFPGVASGLSQYLGSQIGKGTPANPLLQQLLSFFGGGSSSIPGASTLANIANNGISALPEWQQMIAAQQQNIQQNEANLREQFGGMGTLAGSPFGTAMSNYEQQTTLDQNSLLAQLQQQNILQGQIPVAQGLQSGASQMGMFGQTLLPENNPLLGLMGQLSTTFAPMYQTKKGGGILGGLLPSLFSGLGNLDTSGGSSFTEQLMSFLGGL